MATESIRVSKRPAHYAHRQYSYDRAPFQRHRPILGILSAQQSNSSIVALPAQDNFRRTTYQNVGKLLPILVVMINDQGNFRVFTDIAHALHELRRGPFRLFVNGRKKLVAVKDKANGNDVRLAVRISGREVRDARGP